MTSSSSALIIPWEDKSPIIVKSSGPERSELMADILSISDLDNFEVDGDGRILDKGSSDESVSWKLGDSTSKIAF